MSVVNPHNERVRADQLMARGREFRENGPPLPAPGMPRGYVRMLMEERAARFIPGMPQRTRLVWGRCRKPCGDDKCQQAGKCLAGGTIVLPCSRCWDTERINANLTILGPLDDVLGVICERCGGRDGEVQTDLGTSPGYAEAMIRIAEWNAMVDQRRERRMGAEEDRRLARLEAEAREMERQAKEMREIRERNEREQGKR